MGKFDHIFAHSTLTFVHALRTSINIGSQKCEIINRGTKKLFWSRLFKSKKKICKNPKTIHKKHFSIIFLYNLSWDEKGWPFGCLFFTGDAPVVGCHIWQCSVSVFFLFLKSSGLYFTIVCPIKVLRRVFHTEDSFVRQFHYCPGPVRMGKRPVLITRRLYTNKL